jgi:hypothetical protein
MSIQKAMNIVETAIKLLRNIPMAMVIIPVTAAMARVKVLVTTVPARKSPASGKNIIQPIISPPFP